MYGTMLKKYNILEITIKNMLQAYCLITKFVLNLQIYKKQTIINTIISRFDFENIFHYTIHSSRLLLRSTIPDASNETIRKTHLGEFKFL